MQALDIVQQDQIKTRYCRSTRPLSLAVQSLSPVNLAMSKLHPKPHKFVQGINGIKVVDMPIWEGFL